MLTKTSIMKHLVAALFALRSPLFFIGVALALIPGLQQVPYLLVLMNYFLPEKLPFWVLSLRADYFLYLPNAVTLAAYLLGSFAVLEIKRAFWPANQNVRQDLVTGALMGIFALSSLFWMKNLRPGALQILILMIQAAFFWFFLAVNAGFFLFNRLLSRRGFIRFLNITFPFSDVFFYSAHRQRLGAQGGLYRFVPTVLYVLALLGIFGMQRNILDESLPSKKVNVPMAVVTSGWAEWTEKGFWFSNDNWWDSHAGIWFYDEETKIGFPYVRAVDVRRFALEEGAFYFYDRFDSYTYKVDSSTKNLVWKAQTGRFGTPEVMVRNNRVYVIAEGGYILVLNKDNGATLAEKEFPLGTWAPQVLSNGDIAFMARDQHLHIWDNRLETGKTIALPTGNLKLGYSEKQGMARGVSTWTEYDASSGILFIQTFFWGEVFRYDVQHGRWLSPFKTWPGLRSFAVDNKNGLFFALNYFQGFIEVMDLSSGKHVGYILANALGRFINLDPVGKRGIVNTHGLGLYRFEYGDLSSGTRKHPS